MNTQLTKQKLRFTLIASVLTLVLGIVFTAKPDILTHVYIIAGAVMAVIGAVLTIGYFLSGRVDGSQMVYGGIFLAGGIFLCIVPSLLNFLVPVLFGVWIAGGGLSGMLRNFSLRGQHKLWWVGLLLCGAAVALGVFVMTRDVDVMAHTTRIIGIVLIVHAVLRLTATVMARHYYSDPVSEENVIDTNITQ